MLFKAALVFRIDLVTVAMALGNLGGAVDSCNPAAPREMRRIGAEPHGTTEVAPRAARLHLIALEPLGHQANHRLAGRLEFGRVRLGHTTQIACSFDHRHLHAEANAEIRYVALAGEPSGP